MENLPTCTARAFPRRTKHGSVIRVRLSTPAGLIWRCYLPPLSLDEAVTAALCSAGISGAFAQLPLPITNGLGAEVPAANYIGAEGRPSA